MVGELYDTIVLVQETKRRIARMHARDNAIKISDTLRGEIVLAAYLLEVRR
jgi:hypothetical protein